MFRLKLHFFEAFSNLNWVWECIEIRLHFAHKPWLTDFKLVLKEHHQFVVSEREHCFLCYGIYSVGNIGVNYWNDDPHDCENIPEDHFNRIYVKWPIFVLVKCVPQDLRFFLDSTLCIDSA